MSDPGLPSANTRVKRSFPPRWAFFKGLFVGAVIEVPLLAAGVWVLARLGIGNAEVPIMRVVRMTALFAGTAALLTAAGVGRLAAYASIDEIGGRRHAIFVAARAHAAASAGLLVIAAIPHGQLPDRGLGWLALVAGGAMVGAVCGVIVGAVCGGGGTVKIGDVMTAAIRRPGEALRQLLDPDDLLKLGAAVRHRTSQMFEGMFEPAERPPADPERSPEPGREPASPPAPPTSSPESPRRD
jgi:hypothetical protein